jgi:hypothetical protein
MKHNYRAYVINRSGYLIGRVRIACDDDASAKSRVEKLVAVHALELWDGERKIAAFEPRRGSIGIGRRFSLAPESIRTAPRAF